MNSMVYADKCLGDFIANCKTKPWFKNTIFVFVSYHGHPTPGLSNPNFNVFFRIPFLIWGEELKDTYRGK